MSLSTLTAAMPVRSTGRSSRQPSGRVGVTSAGRSPGHRATRSSSLRRSSSQPTISTPQPDCSNSMAERRNNHAPARSSRETRPQESTTRAWAGRPMRATSCSMAASVSKHQSPEICSSTAPAPATCSNSGAMLGACARASFPAMVTDISASPTAAQQPATPRPLFHSVSFRGLFIPQTLTAPFVMHQERAQNKAGLSLRGPTHVVAGRCRKPNKRGGNERGAR